MKKIKVKDIILNHYQKVHELEMDGMTVRVFKPRTMQQLPAYKMLDVIKGYVRDAKYSIRDNDRAYWAYGNPDWGMWDALLVRYVDPRHKTMDIYFAAILVRPFSREAFEWYEQRHSGLEQVERLMLMWDSREFDRIYGYDQSYGRPSNMDEWEYPLYHVEHEEYDIEDKSPSYYFPCESNEPDSLTLKFRHKDGQIENETSWPVNEPMPEALQRLMRIGCDNFLMVTSAHPEVKEMHYYTDTTEWEEDKTEDITE